MAVHVVLQGPIFEFQFYSVSNIKSLSLKQQFYLPGLIPSTKSTSEILNHVQGFPLWISKDLFPVSTIIVSMTVLTLFPVLNV